MQTKCRLNSPTCNVFILMITANGVQYKTLMFDIKAFLAWKCALILENVHEF